MSSGQSDCSVTLSKRLPIHSAPQLIAECEQVKSERETELINEQVLMAMDDMGFKREETLQVRPLGGAVRKLRLLPCLVQIL